MATETQGPRTLAAIAEVRRITLEINAPMKGSRALQKYLDLFGYEPADGDARKFVADVLFDRVLRAVSADMKDKEDPQKAERETERRRTDRLALKALDLGIALTGRREIAALRAQHRENGRFLRLLKAS
jgi:hypothetical protein